VTHSPSKQDADHHDLNVLAAEELNFGLGSVNINLNLLNAFLFVRAHLPFLKKVLE